MASESGNEAGSVDLTMAAGKAGTQRKSSSPALAAFGSRDGAGWCPPGRKEHKASHARSSGSLLRFAAGVRERTWSIDGDELALALGTAERRNPLHGVSASENGHRPVSAQARNRQQGNVRGPG